MTKLSIEIISDFICPWCHIGEEQLFAAGKALEGVELDVAWVPFELNPSVPPAGLNRKEYRTAKFGSWEHSQKLDAHVVQAGKAAGLEFNYDRIEVTPNTRLAHRLVWFAPADRRRVLVPEIFRAYFERGENIGDVEVLVAAAVRAGLPESDARTFLRGETGVEEVLALESAVVRAGINSVPRIRINGRELKGAVRAEDLVDILRTVAAEDGQEPSAP